MELTSDMMKMAHKIQVMMSATWTGPGYSGSAEAEDPSEFRGSLSVLLPCGVSTGTGPLDSSPWSFADACCPSIAILGG